MSTGSVLSDVQNKLVLLALHGAQTEPRNELMAQKLKMKKRGEITETKKGLFQCRTVEKKIN